MTHLSDNRGLALRVGYDATDWASDVSFEQYADAVKDWTIKGVFRDDKCIGAVYFNGDELHVSILPEWRRKWATKGFLSELFAKDRVVTRVTPGHEYMHGILKRLGFVQQDDMFIRGH